MHKIFSGVDHGTSVETSGGGKVVGEYFGLHNSKQAEKVGALSQSHGESAKALAEYSNRLKLNEGVPFDGFFISINVDHVTLNIGTHRIFGLSAHINRPTSHPEGRIEVITDQQSKPMVVSRNEFYSDLLPEVFTEQLANDFAKRHWRV